MKKGFPSILGLSLPKKRPSEDEDLDDSEMEESESELPEDEDMKLEAAEDLIVALKGEDAEGVLDALKRCGAYG